MHILLTDTLRCPRCGPEFGLILLADRIENRRVIDGVLGCPNCRKSYPIQAGVADLRHPDSPPLEIDSRLEIDTRRGPTTDESVFRLAALLGAQASGSKVLLLGLDEGSALAIEKIFPDSHLVFGSPEPETALDAHVRALPGHEETEPAGTLSRTVLGNRLPFATGAFAAAAVVGSPSATLLSELLRVLRAGARLVIEGAAPGSESSLRALGFGIDLSQDGTVVAAVRSPR